MKKRKHSYIFRVLNIATFLFLLPILLFHPSMENPIVAFTMACAMGMNIDWFMEDYF